MLRPHVDGHGVAARALVELHALFHLQRLLFLGLHAQPLSLDRRAGRSVACLCVLLARAAFRPLRPFRLAWIARGRWILGALRPAQRLPADALAPWRAQSHFA